ncbi:MAG: glycosyltransferase family 2 protein [Lentisphaerales bacterium]|nr:glycosyltransferase family 2 protein [Lentisphaerales bacterium]
MKKTIKTPKLSVIIPAYNEEKTIEIIISKVRSVDLPIEIIVVNDCSSDRTKEILDELDKKNDLRVLHHDTNQGKGAAIRTAQKAITGDLVIIQDADLEYDPIEFPKLYKFFLEREADAVYGSRYSGNEVMVDTFIHYYGNRILTTFSNILTNLHLTDMETCYKMIRADIFKQFKIECHCFGFEPEITAKLVNKKARIFEVPIYYEPRLYDEGKKITWIDGVKAFWYIVKFNIFRK